MPIVKTKNRNLNPQYKMYATQNVYNKYPKLVDKIKA